MFKATGMRSWNLNADDLEKTFEFYKDVLGAEETQRHTIGDAAVARLKVGDSGIGLFDSSGGPRFGVPHHTFFGEGPGDPEELVRDLEVRGIKVEGVRHHGATTGYSIYVEDPGGNRIELSVDPN
jgi:catechol-2,3-dioxygenase